MTGCDWKTVLELDQSRQVRGGSPRDLAAAIARGADLRVYTEWRFEEHLTPWDNSLEAEANAGLVREVIDFRQTMLVNGTHVACVNTLRQPLIPTIGFYGTDARIAYYLYNMTGHQAVANVGIDPEAEYTGEFGKRTIIELPLGAVKSTRHECYDLGTAAACRNFIYDMEVYRFIVRDDWQEVLSHDAKGNVLSGSLDALEASFAAGRELKVGIRGCLNELGEGPESEVFALAGSSFLHTEKRLFDCGLHPIVRMRPSVPVQYRSGEWDVAWLIPRTDGVVSIRSLNPKTQRFSDHTTRFACRWFAR